MIPSGLIAKKNSVHFRNPNKYFRGILIVKALSKLTIHCTKNDDSTYSARVKDGDSDVVDYNVSHGDCEAIVGLIRKLQNVYGCTVEVTGPCEKCLTQS